MKQTPQPHHEWLKLQNFTVFRDAEFTFNPGINVFIGENGTGKTHLLKLLYGVQKDGRDGETLKPDLARDLALLFQQLPESLMTRPILGDTIMLGGWGEREWRFEMRRDNPANLGWTSIPHRSRPVFIPAVDMLGHTRRFITTYDSYNIDFDQTYRDLVGWLLSPERRNLADKQTLMLSLRDVIGGEVREDDERFFFDTPNGSFPATLVAEGLRKIGTLYTLIKNGCLEEGSTLFWDEPDVNVNPILLGPLVDTMLDLAKSSVQIFIATHSYELLKEFDLQAKRNSVRYFSLERTENGTVVHSSDIYDDLTPNRIDDEFDSLYDRVLTKATGRARK